MRNLMMKRALSITSLMRYVELNHGSQEVVSLTGDNNIQCFSYSDIFGRVRKLANALESLGVSKGDCVATMAWNDHRHFELYYAISCIGGICHTINPRLFEEQIIYIANHAEDTCLFLDPMFVDLVEPMQTQLTTIKNYVVLCDKEEMPETALKNASSYEALISDQSNEYNWPDLDEDTPSSLCYTSGTTGNPKGVLYSHRSNILHSYGAALPDSMNLSALDVVLPVVPMYHANAWGVNYAVPMVGAKLVLPGPKAGDPATLTQLINEENVTLTAGVPTVWLALLNYLNETGQTLPSLQRTVVGGAACPPAIMEEFLTKHEVETKHAWGMTELSPLGSIFSPKPGYNQLSDDEKSTLKAKQGRCLYGIEMKISDDNNQDLPRDGKSFGSLKVRGNWVMDEYYKSDSGKSSDDEGWFETGDVATIDADGYMNIVDRTKDVIKSGGEWISSIDLENVALDHPAVQEAAVIGVPHPQWTERPLLIVVLKEPAQKSDDLAKDILASMTGKVAKWWIPERLEFLDSIPHTATGKISKLQLRQQFESLS